MAQGIIERVNEPSRHVSPMVIVPKSTGIRICIDMRLANRAIIRENHPLPTLDDIWPQLNKATVFSIIDIKNAFHQVELSPESRHITTFITKRGLLRYTRLMFGITNAPELFQKTLVRILIGCKGVINYLDDILIFGSDKEDHDVNFKKVMERLRSYNVLLNSDKSKLAQSSVKFLGHEISAKGVAPCKDKLESIKKFRQPSTAEELRSFLGLVTYLGRFIPDLATLSDPLRQIINKKQPFSWGPENSKQFQEIKSSIVNGRVLGYFNKKDESIVISDASPVGLGAILIQKERTGEERIIMFASKSLSETERRYCQTEKEALAIVWAVERFHYYLYGHKFTLITDHKPLTFMFKPLSKPCARIERWVLRLQSYIFNVVYKKGKDNIADTLSRLSAVDKSPSPFDEDSDHYVCQITEGSSESEIVSPVTLKEIRDCCTKSKEYLDLMEGFLNNNWEANVARWQNLSGEFSIENGLIVRGCRLYIPPPLRDRILCAGHEGHPGKNKLLQRLREKVWWPEMTKDVETKTKSCTPCVLVSSQQPQIPLKMRKMPSTPWCQLAMDFTEVREFKKELLVIIDYHSRFMDIKVQNSTKADETIKSLQEIFPLLGYPESITCDNGPPFNSREFQQYCDSYQIEIIHTIPMWAQANGLVERQNRSIKKETSD